MNFAYMPFLLFSPPRRASMALWLRYGALRAILAATPAVDTMPPCVDAAMLMRLMPCCHALYCRRYMSGGHGAAPRVIDSALITPPHYAAYAACCHERHATIHIDADAAVTA